MAKANAALEIDIHDLHTECANQPKLQHQWSDELATCQAETDRLKGVVELVKAQLDGKIRESPGSYGLAKATDDSVKMAIIRDDRYQAALGDLNEAEESAGRVKAMVIAVQQRKSAIEDLVKLRLADYYADPVLPKGTREEVDMKRRQQIAKETQEVRKK